MKPTRIIGKGFTVIEVVVAALIVGIIAAFALPAFYEARQRAFDNEARSMLMLISQSEKMYDFQRDEYGACDNTAACEGLLGIEIPNSTKWTNYNIIRPSGTKTFRITADGNDRDWRMTESDDEPCCIGTKCAPGTNC